MACFLCRLTIARAFRMKRRIVLSNTFTSDSGTSRMVLRKLLIARIGLTIGSSGLSIRVGISLFPVIFLISSRKRRAKWRYGNTQAALVECNITKLHIGIKSQPIGEGNTSSSPFSFTLPPFFYPLPFHFMIFISRWTCYS